MPPYNSAFTSIAPSKKFEMDPSHPPKPGAPAPSSSTNTTAIDSSPKYVPQFSAATEMILKRISSGTSGGSLGPIGNTGMLPGYDEMRRSVMMGMKTSMNMELPPTPPTGGRRNQGGRASVGSSSSAGATIAPKGTAAGTPKAQMQAPAQKNGVVASGGRGKAGAKSRARAGTKRKRVMDETDESSSDSLAMSGLGDESDTDNAASITEDFPKVTSSGRAVNKPAHFMPAVSDTPPKKRAPSKKSQENALCKRCGRGHSPANNMIVFCDDCNLGWHQMCHDPAVPNEAVRDVEADWFCVDCTKRQESKRNVKKPIPPELPKLVSWEERSDAEKRAYFSSLPPQQLVNILLQVTAMHPTLPIFPAVTAPPPMQAYLPPQPSQQARTNPNSHATAAASFNRTAGNFHTHPPTPFPPSVTVATGLFSRAEANPNAPINFIRKIASGSTRATPPSNASSPSTMQPPTFNKTSSAPPTLPPQLGPGTIGGVVGDDSRESTPASPPYPKAGNGLMAKLGPDDQDREWLDDESDFLAFSHVIYDQNGAANHVS